MNKEDNKIDLLVLGNFFGKLLEGFPIRIRSTALKEIERAEERYCRESSGLLRPILAQELWKIENSQSGNRDPRLTRRKVLASYGNTIECYLAALPQNLRVDILREICNIISHHGTF